MNKGLVPKTQQNQPELKVVFLWNRLERASMIICPGDVIIQVDVPEECRIYRRRNEAGFLTETEAYEYFVRQKISPDRLKVVHREPPKSRR
jgi:hypothetical protein